MAKKHYNYNNEGKFEETLENGMVGWEYTEDGATKRIIAEKVEILYHAKHAFSVYVKEALVGSKWIKDEVVKANANTYTFRNATTFETEFEPYEMVDDLTKPILGAAPVEGTDEEGNPIYGERPVIGYQQKQQLKSGLINEWDFFYSLFMGSGSSISLETYIKQGAIIKAGVNLVD